MKLQRLFGAMLLSAFVLTANPASARDPLATMLSGKSMTKGKKLERAIEKASEHPFGSAKNPVRAAMPTGQRAYLSRLRCANGAAPTYFRGGSVGDSPYGNIMDVYNVDCGDAEPGSVEIFMDMYHKGHVESAPVPGFTIMEP
ncbi:MAG: hypothetical protein ACI9TB_001060 [Parasphingorhabdus sp.]|jgi:hypothetical protein|uniref:hypothetical protein n=1 Tax=Parasphingorhabdus sp. TaxID=2709688 RepID=UPI0039E4B370